jgi:hypothetical protein
MGEMPMRHSFTLPDDSTTKMPPTMLTCRLEELQLSQYASETKYRLATDNSDIHVFCSPLGFTYPDMQPFGYSSLAALSNKAAQNRINKFSRSLQDAKELTNSLMAADEGDPLDEQTLAFALNILYPLILSIELPTPLILPLQNGGIGVEWHDCGLNIELRFRKPYDVYAKIEDALEEIPSHYGRDSNLIQTRTALFKLCNRFPCD